MDSGCLPSHRLGLGSLSSAAAAAAAAAEGAATTDSAGPSRNRSFADPPPPQQPPGEVDDASSRHPVSQRKQSSLPADLEGSGGGPLAHDVPTRAATVGGALSGREGRHAAEAYSAALPASAAAAVVASASFQASNR